MGNPDSLKPEKGTNYEIGIRRYTKNLHLSLAVYSMTIEDKIRYDYLNDKYETPFHLIIGVETIWIDILLL